MRLYCALRLVLLLAITGWTSAAEMVGRTPAQGWNSWNTFRCDINETLIKQVADAMVSSGLKDAGYVYVNLDDCWMEKRAPDGSIVPFANKFPSGMKALGDYIHKLGLKFGVYSDTGNHTCEGYPGSMGHEVQDAQTYAGWGVDYLKYDYCGMEGVKESVEASYTRMHDALVGTGRPIHFSLCSWGGGQPHLWGKKVGHQWRTGIDLFAAWDASHAKQLKLPNFLQPVLSAIDNVAALGEYAGPGGFNDPDMLVVGLEGMTPYGIVQECPEHVIGCTPGTYVTREKWGMVGGLTNTEQRTHFAFWCMLASPLILGNDPRVMSKATLEILLAKEVVAVNQDPLGKQARKVYTAGAQNETQIWVKELSGNRVAALLFNAGNSTASITIQWSRDMPELSKVWARELPPATDAVCQDKDAKCAEWAAHGECEKNPGFMADKCSVSCPKSCRAPPVEKGPKATALVRDAWLEEDQGFFAGQFTATKVESHASRLIILHFVEPNVTASMQLDTGVPAFTASHGGGRSSISAAAASSSKHEVSLQSAAEKTLRNQVEHLAAQLADAKQQAERLSTRLTSAEGLAASGRLSAGGESAVIPTGNTAVAVSSQNMSWLTFWQARASIALNMAFVLLALLIGWRLPQRDKDKHGHAS